jgi:hypothetical protein
MTIRRITGLGDGAFWIGPPNNVTLYVFLGGTTRLMIGQRSKQSMPVAVGQFGRLASF